MRANTYPLFFYFTLFILSVSLITTQGCQEDPCSEIACLNGGICAAGTCICPEGFRGERCHILDGENCGDEICLNGGTCVNDTCQCPPGWSGNDCSIQVPDPCDNITCLNGGVCVNGNCNCPPEFSGRFCEINEQSDPCDNIECQNGGTCVGGVCDCPPGFSGVNCEIEDVEPDPLSPGTYTGTVECTPLSGGATTNEQLTVVITENGGVFTFEFSGVIEITSDGTPAGELYEFSEMDVDGTLVAGPADSQVTVSFLTATQSCLGILSN